MVGVSYGALAPERPQPAPAAANLHRRNAALVSCLAAALVLAVVAMSSVHTPAPQVLLSTAAEERFLAARQVAAAQANVARDIAALRKTQHQAGTKPQQLSIFDLVKNGPHNVEPLPEPTEGGLVMEDPENEFVHTPRVFHKHRYGPNARDCPGGNCDNLNEAGVATDRWPIDVYSAVPSPGWDPSADPVESRAINERTGEYARHMRADTYHPPVKWGLGHLEGQGDMAEADKGAEALEGANVNHDRWPFDVYRAMPNPAWDRTQYDQTAHEDRMPHSDALESVKEEHDSQQALQDAGVKVNGAPGDNNNRAYNQVDGLYDKLIPVENAPEWRKGGTATQELPTHFLLREHPDMSAPQPTYDKELGYEHRSHHKE